MGLYGYSGAVFCSDFGCEYARIAPTSDRDFVRLLGGVGEKCSTYDGHRAEDYAAGKAEYYLLLRGMVADWT